MVKELRDKTGAGVMDAKKALEASNGDMARAEKALAEKGLASAAKKVGRQTSEGVISSYIHSGSRIGAMVELNCETDFVARTPEFQELARNLAMQIAAMTPRYVSRAEVPAAVADVKDEELLLEQAYIRDSSKKVEDLIKESIARVGENIQVRRFSRFALGE
jgi:elongation factor Ts